jgi:hypothetical protein
MSGFNVIHDVGLELRSQIFGALQATPGSDFSLTTEAENITLQPPQDGLADAVRASLFLYHIDLDKHLRGQRPLADRTRDDLYHKPPLPLQLRFVFTPLRSTEEDNLSLLGRVLQHFHDTPDITSLGGMPLDDSRGGASPVLRIRSDMLSLEQLTQLWNALSRPYRLSVAFLVEVVAIDSGLPAQRARRVEQITQGVGLARDAEGST